jgi:hypothetical protein
VCPYNTLSFGLVVKKVIHFRRCTVKGTNDESVISHVENQVLTHDSQTNQTNISSVKEEEKKIR